MATSRRSLLAIALCVACAGAPGAGTRAAADRGQGELAGLRLPERRGPVRRSDDHPGPDPHHGRSRGRDRARLRGQQLGVHRDGAHLDAGLGNRKRNGARPFLRRRDPERHRDRRTRDFRTAAQGRARRGPRQPDRLRPEARHRGVHRRRLAEGRPHRSHGRDARLQHGESAGHLERAGRDHDPAGRTSPDTPKPEP